LLEREGIVRQAGFEVFSANTEDQARFEIEMGKMRSARGVLLICSRTSPVEAQELTHLFRNYCLHGRIIFVVNDAKDRLTVDTDLFILERFLFPEAGE
jgi:hypothetical protein